MMEPEYSLDQYGMPIAEPEPYPCNGGCGRTDATSDVEEQYSLGIYAGRWCSRCWRTSGYHTEGRSGFDPADAGESYEED